MPDTPRHGEDLPRIAADAYALSARLCGDCRNQHALWTYLRLSRASTGAERQESNLEEKLREFFATGRRNILIAGAQDTGLLALVARAGNGYSPHIVVLDVCETPLQLCRSLAATWSLPIEIVRQDLFELDITNRFDIVLVHGTLNFIPAERQPQVLVRLQRSMRPGGRLVLLFNVSQTLDADRAAENHAEYADFGELERLKVPLPDDEAVMRDRFIARARQRERRDRQFTDPGEARQLVAGADFDIHSCSLTSGDLAKPADALLAKFSKQRFMLIAEPRPGKT